MKKFRIKNLPKAEVQLYDVAGFNKMYPLVYAWRASKVDPWHVQQTYPLNDPSCCLEEVPLTIKAGVWIRVGPMTYRVVYVMNKDESIPILVVLETATTSTNALWFTEERVIELLSRATSTNIEDMQ